MGLLGLDLPVPDHTTLSRRAATLEVPRPRSGSRSDYGHDTEPVHLLVDSTGLKLCGPGEWLIEKHGTRRRRSWRKLVWGFWYQALNVKAGSFPTSHPRLLQPGFGSVHNDPRGTRHRARTIAPHTCIRRIQRIQTMMQ